MLSKTDDADMDMRRWNALPLEPGEQGVVRLHNAGLIERGSQINAHGWLDLESINLLRVDEYQREVLRGKAYTKLFKVAQEGAAFPDIMLGMRGQRIRFPKGASVCELLDPVYIVDGLQRVFALKSVAAAEPERAAQIRIGAEVRFDTTKSTEQELFRVINTQRTPVSPNVILRNMREQHPSILTLYGLCHSDKNFALYERVCWNQRMSRQELLTALILTRASRTLHQADHMLMGSGDKTSNLAPSLDAIMEDISMMQFRRNIGAFWDMVDACYGVRTVEYNQLASQLCGNFLVTLSRLLAVHENFWDGHKLVIDAAHRHRLASFPVQDPEVARLAGAGNATMPLLYAMMVEHMNKSKRTHRLILRRPQE